MCFSATASFITGGTLTVVGGATLSKSKNKKELPLASIPFLFGIQQIIEGIIWVSFRSIFVNTIATYIYLFFAYVLWPILTPIAILLVETHPMRRRILQIFFVVGLVIGLYLLHSIITEPRKAHIINQSIAYNFHYAQNFFYVVPYVIVTTGSAIISSYKILKFFGLFTLIAFFISKWFYSVTFVSVWCFFAAVLSLFIFLFFLKKTRD